MDAADRAAAPPLLALLQGMVARRASDLFLADGAPAQFKIDGELQPAGEALPEGGARALLAGLLPAAALARLDAEGELNAGHRIAGLASFRLSAFRQRGAVAAVIRAIPVAIPTLAELKLPDSLARLMLEKRGLVLVVGATGSGKSTTLAAMIDHRNRERPGHVLTIEDPIEFHFPNHRALVNQREIGRDVADLATGLRNALRQAPDCLLIGEIRDRETLSAAISFALSGHLVLATLHANNAHHALGRILSFYPPEARPVLLDDLAAALKAVVSQRLLPAVGGGRLAAVELLRNSPLVAERIAQGDLQGVKAAMVQSLAEGSQSFEEDLARLIASGQVRREDALAQADSPSNLMWRLDHGAAARPAAAEAPAAASAAFPDLRLDASAP